MSRIAVSAAFAGIALAAPAHATVPSVESTYKVTGTVVEACTVTTDKTVAFGSDITGGGLDITIVSALTPATDPGTVCNGANTAIAVSHTSMANQTFTGTAPSNFSKTLTFRPVVTVAGQTINGDTAADVKVGAFKGLAVSADTLSAGSGNTPMAGTYEGQIKLTLKPVP